jgi:NAD(P)-dependent dehydrogenase (short-subunit alcohol dehydrogenase family)
MKSTMGDDRPLTVTSILRHGATWHGQREVVTAEDEQTTSRVSYEQIAAGAIHPGAVATPLLMGGGLTEEAFVQRGKDRLAVPRIAAPEEISPAVVYFASDLSGYATGSELLVDGGWAIG